MNSRQLFFLSLVILSVAMAVNWFRNRPEPVTVSPAASSRARGVRYEDFEIKDTQDKITLDDSDDFLLDDPDDRYDKKVKKCEQESQTDKKSDSKEEKEIVKEEKEEEPKDKHTEKKDSTYEQSIPKFATGKIVEDKLIKNLLQLRRNPFSYSPYLKMIDDLSVERTQIQEVSQQQQIVEKRDVRIINARFTATIETEGKIVAVIDSELFKVGDIFRGNSIKSIKEEYVRLETEDTMFLIPKHGVNISIEESGAYTVVDSFR